MNDENTTTDERDDEQRTVELAMATAEEALAKSRRTEILFEIVEDELDELKSKVEQVDHRLDVVEAEQSEIADDIDELEERWDG